MRRGLHFLSTILIVAGGLLLLDAGLTAVWQEPLTGLATKLRQSSLSGDLRSLERTTLTPVERDVLGRLESERLRIAFLARSLSRRVDHGGAVGRVRIARMGTDFVLVKGSRAADLRRGPGIYDDSPFPGAPGTTAIAGHRTWYLAPFRRIDRLRAGDPIVVDMPYADFTYRVERHEVVGPAEVAVLRRAPYDRLVLTACHPLFSAAKRWVVFARLAAVVPSPQAAGASSRRRWGLTPGAPPSDRNGEPQATSQARGGLRHEAT